MLFNKMRSSTFDKVFPWLLALVFVLIAAANVAIVWVIIHFVEKYW